MGSCTSKIGYVLLTLNSVIAIYKSQDDGAATAFLVTSYLLFCNLHLLQNAPSGSVTREHLKVAVWILSTLLTIMSCWKVSAPMPGPMAAFLWFMAAATVLGGFYAFFLYPATPPEADGAEARTETDLVPRRKRRSVRRPKVGAGGAGEAAEERTGRARGERHGISWRGRGAGEEYEGFVDARLSSP